MRQTLHESADYQEPYALPSHFPILNLYKHTQLLPNNHDAPATVIGMSEVTIYENNPNLDTQSSKTNTTQTMRNENAPESKTENPPLITAHDTDGACFQAESVTWQNRNPDNNRPDGDDSISIIPKDDVQVGLFLFSAFEECRLRLTMCS